MPTDTMRIWDAVSKTNPDNTKKVNQRGGFTSICAQSQIMEATRQFGPVGQGWGYAAEAPIFHDNIVFVRVTLWHGDRANVFGPVTGGAEWKSDKGRLDTDAPKKATTDALTKLLSQLGFNADVFLGLYDDNKYVQQVTREFQQQAKADEPAKELPTGPINDTTRDWVSDQVFKNGLDVGELCRALSVTSLKALTYEQMDAVKAWLKNNRKAA
jgi:choline dehydrogenase-like flavoprotein